MNKRHSKLSKFVGGCLLSGMLLFGAVPSQAEFTFNPLFVVVDAPSGKATGSITISNPFEKPARIQISMSEFEVNESNEFTIIEKDKSKDTVLKHVRITPRQFTIKPKETKTVRIATRIPGSYPDGEYKLFLNMLEIGADRKEAAAGDDEQAFGLVINKQFRAGTYIRKGKDLKSDMKVVRIAPTETEGSVAKYQLTYQNEGKIHVRKDIGVRFYEQGTEKVVHETPFSGVLIAFPTSENLDQVTVEKSIRIPDSLDASKKYDAELILVDSIEDPHSKAQNNPTIVTDRFEI